MAPAVKDRTRAFRCASGSRQSRSNIVALLRIFPDFFAPQVETTATCVRMLGSGDSSDLFVMARVETVADVRAARGCSAASAYKIDVLMSWDMVPLEHPSASDAATAFGVKQQTSLDERHSEMRGKQIEISNGLLLHEVYSIVCTCCAVVVNADSCPLHVELGGAVGSARIAGIVVHCATVRSVK